MRGEYVPPDSGSDDDSDTDEPAHMRILCERCAHTGLCCSHRRRRRTAYEGPMTSPHTP